MPQNITRSLRDLVAEANQQVRVLDIAEAMAMHGREDVTFIDLRDIREVARTGTVDGARHVPRGMLEFWLCPDSPYHKPFFAEDKTFVFYCAAGLRSALAAKTAQDLGLKPVAHLDGGMEAWLKAAGPLDLSKKKSDA